MDVVTSASPDPNGSTMPKRSRSPLRRAIIALSLLGIALIAWGASLHRPPLREPPSFGPVSLELVPEASVTFLADFEAGIPYEVVLEFDVSAELEPLGSIVRGGWQGYEGAPQLVARCDVTAADGTKISEVTGDHLVGLFGRTTQQILVCWARGLKGRVQIDLYVESAAPELRQRACRVLAVPWVERCGMGLDASALVIFAGLLLLVLAILLFLVHLVLSLVARATSGSGADLREDAS